MAALLRFFLCLCLGLLFLTVARAEGLPAWNGPAQGKFIRSVATDARGHLWVGTESDGVWTLSPAAPEKGWTRYGLTDGMGEDTATALAGDPKGRVWVGHLGNGVSVFNGQSWKNYNALSGPLGVHVFALTVSPKDGDVWIATETGLTRYLQGKDTWRNYGQAEGLPSGQIQALAFDKNGTLYAGSQCDGLAVGTAADDYAAWRHVPGPGRLPATSTGAGLPTGRINALLATRDGSVYAGTPSGLAGSQDGGKTWSYARGGDWQAKAQGMTGGPPADLTAAAAGTLAEDWITALGEDAAGHLWIGHRSRGIEVFDPAAARSLPLPASPQPYVNDVSCLLADAGPSVLIGGYGSGLSFAAPPNPAILAWPAHEGISLPPFPSPAAPPTVAELKALAAAFPATGPGLKPGEGAFLGDDWQTQGDWVGRYGRQYASLCGINSPSEDEESGETGYEASVEVGPHHKESPGPYTYISVLETPDRRFPYSPHLGHRRDAEVNDGSWQGNKYSPTYDGPDLWVTFQVPAGAHRASFYFVNNDGHDGANRWRDYLLELKPDKPTLEAEDAAPALAQARVTEFYSGVYKQFLVQGPGTFHLKIGRCYSFCTKLQGIFLDRVSDAPAPAAALAPAADDAKPYLGVLTAPVGSLRGALENDGLFVVQVSPGSPAAQGGLSVGDILLSANGQPLTDSPMLNALIAGQHVGDTLHLQIKRADQKKTLAIVLRARPADLGGAASQSAHPLPLGGVSYAPPPVPAPDAKEDEVVTAARALWSALDAGEGHEGGAALQAPDRLLAYRAAQAAQASPALLANWRWTLCLWTDADRLAFDQVMASARRAQRAQPPESGLRQIVHPPDNPPVRVTP